ncbi:MAG: bifunctional [glutamine synthetase] adenylyltransferase/[glutamine synthetase]-adenylyl-L-tyrosine phosphorylase [Rhodospirillaceae bacterium]
MPPPDLIFNYPRLPVAADPDQTLIGLERLSQAVDQCDDEMLGPRFSSVMADGEKRNFIEAVFGASPFLTQSATTYPVEFVSMIANGPDQVLADCFAALTSEDLLLSDESYASKRLRNLKRLASVAIALGDLSRTFEPADVTAHISRVAGDAVRVATSVLLRKYAKLGAFSLADENDPETGSGFIVLGMGKLGAYELNYSSDIDLMVFFDRDVIDTDNPDNLNRQFVRLTRDLVTMLSERTADGYVFRTDLRLRPDPSSTPLAMSVDAAETYYESMGQNWERAVMIKARQIAGDSTAGELFLQRLQPFVWRKNLDFAAIEDIHSIKRQINSHRGGSAIAVEGHNVKLGRGGIREIEFYAQTQQLIWGGRDPSLREQTTCGALLRLADAGKVEPEIAADLSETYWYLRTVEHRLQMMEDQQTHTLPEDPDALMKFAAFMGYEQVEAFREELLFHLRLVETHYARLFEKAAELSHADEVGGNLSFTGSDDDPDTLQTLARLGFENPSLVIETVRGWHRGRYRATATERARQIMTELAPELIAVFGATPDPDGAFRQFDAFLSGLPSGIQLFSLFRAHPPLLSLLAEIMGSTPKLAEHLGRHPSCLDSVLEPDFYERLPPLEELGEELDGRLLRDTYFEEVLDTVRIWSDDRRLQLGVQALKNLSGWQTICRGYSDIAEAALTRLQAKVEEEFQAQHGNIPGGNWLILAMGKLGGREMTPASDLDLIIVYDHDEDATQSDGEKPLSVGQYYARLTQRLINAVTAPTANGKLYEIDMRLRPSGNAGPIASHISGFSKYQEEAAWTWEQMALSRSRVLGSASPLAEKTEAIIRENLTRKRDPETLKTDIAEMRQRIDGERHTESIWDIKYVRGGLLDVEFVAQYLQLLHAQANPDILSQNTREAVENLSQAGLLYTGEADSLIDALDLYQAVQGLLRLTIAGDFRPANADEVPRALQIIMFQVGQCDGFDALVASLKSSATEVSTIYQRHLPDPS